MHDFDWKKEAEREWDKNAAFWNKRSINMWDHGSRKNIVSFMKKHIPAGGAILDIGCGDGYGSYKLYQEGYKVTGADLSAEMIHYASERVKHNEIKFIQGDVMEVPLADETFDGIMSINVLEWTESPLQALREISRVLKPNGLLCAGILGPTAGPRANSYPRFAGEKAICNTMMPWEFSQLAAELNLEYADGYGVYKEGVTEKEYSHMPVKLKQALSFLWVFMLQKKEGVSSE